MSRLRPAASRREAPADALLFASVQRARRPSSLQRAADRRPTPRRAQLPRVRRPSAAAALAKPARRVLLRGVQGRRRAPAEWAPARESAGSPELRRLRHAPAAAASARDAILLREVQVPCDRSSQARLAGKNSAADLPRVRDGRRSPEVAGHGLLLGALSPARCLPSPSREKAGRGAEERDRAGSADLRRLRQAVPPDAAYASDEVLLREVQVPCD